jgi:hypothetical protein
MVPAIEISIPFCDYASFFECTIMSTAFLDYILSGLSHLALSYLALNIPSLIISIVLSLTVDSPLALTVV